MRFTCRMQIALLRAFEAAARSGSFQGAAAELHLTPSAVSHAIRKLEQELGVALFERRGRRVHVSADGEMLLRHVGSGFDSIRRGLALVSNRGPRILRVHCAPSFAAQWLTPRLQSFLSRHPDLEIRLSAGVDYTRFTNEEFDLDIVYGPPRLEGVVVLPLGEEVITPLCAPKFTSLVRRPDDLLRCPLIDSSAKKFRWPDWLSANGLPARSPSGMRFDRSFLAISSAVNGLGIALESTRLAEREIAEGKLVPVLQGVSNDVRYVGHYLVFPHVALRRHTLQLFVRWMLNELQVDYKLD